MHRVVLMLLLSACAGGSSGPGGDNGNDAGSDTGAVSDSGGQVGVPGLGIGVSAGGDHTCVHIDNGDVHCWGRSHVGQLGLSTATNLGDNEEPTGSRVDVGAEVVQVSVGGLHTCALTSEGAVKCWGLADLGALGYGNMEEIGIEDTPASVGEVPLPGIAVEVKAGASFTCARLATGDVTCWGQDYGGWLGQGRVVGNIGDNETPDSLAPIDLGGRATQIAVGRVHSCAVLDDQSLRCWGEGPATGHGEAGTFVGDDETPAAAGDPLGAAVDRVWVGGRVTCARLVAGGIQCWGDGSDYELGRPGPDGQEQFGVEEVVSNAAEGPIHDFGEAVVDMILGSHYSCALLESGVVKCWGQHWSGVLGQGEVGSKRVAVDAPEVPLGGAVQSLGGNLLHNCAIMEGSEDLVCWGEGVYGKLGYGSENDIGDDETPESMGTVSFR